MTIMGFCRAVCHCEQILQKFAWQFKEFKKKEFDITKFDIVNCL